MLAVIPSRQEKVVKMALALAVIVNIVFWFSVRDVEARWENVPPVPDIRFAASSGLGDAQLSYRIIGLMIQNLGDTGGRSTALKEYNYDELAKWFFLQDHLDPRSNYMPYLAAYYFSAVQTPESFRPALDYLVTVGQRPEGEKWRFLAQAVFLARFVMKDTDKALELAKLLAELDNSEMPSWTRQMPVFIMNASGEKETAYALMLEILRTSADKMHPNEVRNMRYYICQKILDKAEAKSNELCKDIPLN